MDESVEKGLELLPGNGSGASIPKSSEIGRIIVKGYDTSLPLDVVEKALRKHYSSCGEITDVYVPMNDRWKNTLWPSSYVYFVGEGAVDKALQLNGTDVGGWTVSSHAHQFPPHPNDNVSVRVEGYDTSLSKDDIEIALKAFLSPCGKVESLLVGQKSSSAVADICGDNAAVEVPKLSGSVVGGCRLVVTRISDLGMSTTHPRHRGYRLLNPTERHREKARRTSAEYKSLS